MNPFIGQLLMFCGNFAPLGWALCNGQLLPISEYTALFSILGTTYGGDGKSNFALPDLRGRVVIHPGQGPGLSSYFEGQTGGAETTTLNVANLPAHTHAARVSLATGTFKEGIGNAFGQPSSGDLYTTSPANKAMSVDSIGPTGSNQGFSNVQPYLSINFIIALQGVFPSRS